VWLEEHGCRIVATKQAPPSPTKIWNREICFEDRNQSGTIPSNYRRSKRYIVVWQSAHARMTKGVYWPPSARGNIQNLPSMQDVCTLVVHASPHDRSIAEDPKKRQQEVGALNEMGFLYALGGRGARSPIAYAAARGLSGRNGKPILSSCKAANFF
jgi:hypothetical protein